MKIGINYKSIKNFVITSITQMSILFNDTLNTIQSDINNLDTRITTLEETSSSSSDVVIATHIFQMYDVNESVVNNINVNRIGNDVFLNFSYKETFNRIDTLAIGYNLVELGIFNLGNNNENIFKCSGTIPVIYHLGDTDTYYHNGLLKISYDTESNINIIELVIDNGDLSKWTDVVSLATTLIIDGSGSFHVEEITNSGSGSLPM